MLKRTQNNLNIAQGLKDEALEALAWKADPEVWSALECVDHLNQYDAIYIPNIHLAIEKSSSASQQQFKSGLLGNWFANLMRPGDAGKKMKTFKSKNPNGKVLDKQVLSTFILDQEMLLKLLELAQSKNLNTVKVPTAFGRWMSINLGDAFRLIIYHNQRHLEQAQNSLAKYAVHVRAHYAS